MGVAGAIVAGAGISAAAGLAGGAMQAGATGAAANKARASQEMAYRIAEAKLAPYTSAGEGALGNISALMGLQGPDVQQQAYDNFRTDPGYQFALDEGLRAVDAGAAARGILRSGATLKGEERFAEGLASQEFGNYINRLYQLTGIGQRSALQEGADVTNLGTGLANTALGQGAAESSIYGNAAKGIGNAANALFQNPQFQDWLGIGGGSAFDTSANRLAGLAPSVGSTPTGFGLFGSAGPGVGADFAGLGAIY